MDERMLKLPHDVKPQRNDLVLGEFCVCDRNRRGPMDLKVAMIDWGAGVLESYGATEIGFHDHGVLGLTHWRGPGTSRTVWQMGGRCILDPDGNDCPPASVAKFTARHGRSWEVDVLNDPESRASAEKARGIPAGSRVAWTTGTDSCSSRIARKDMIISGGAKTSAADRSSADAAPPFIPHVPSLVPATPNSAKQIVAAVEGLRAQQCRRQARKGAGIFLARSSPVSKRPRIVDFQRLPCPARTSRQDFKPAVCAPPLRTGRAHDLIRAISMPSEGPAAKSRPCRQEVRTALLHRAGIPPRRRRQLNNRSTK